MGRRASKRALKSRTSQIGFIAVIVAATVVVAAVLFQRTPDTKGIAVKQAPLRSIQEVGRMYEQGNYKQALPELLRLVDDDPRDAQARTMLASALWLDGKHEQALAQYRTLAEQNPEDADTRYRLGLLLRQWDKLDEAVVELEAAVEFRPDSALFLVELAKAYVKKGRYDEAIENWRTALDAYPTDSPARSGIYAELGDTYVLMEESRRAREAYRAGLKIDPENSYLESQLEKI